MLQYTQDNDERYMILSVNAKDDSTTTAPYSNPYGWADAIFPYMKSIQVYQCPTEPFPQNSDPTITGGATSAERFTDYWLNAALANNSMASVAFPANTVMSGDGASGRSRAGSKGTGGNDAGVNGYNYGGDSMSSGCTLPDDALIPLGYHSNDTSPRFRHLNGPNLLFSDGHVKYFTGVSVPATGDYYMSPKVTNCYPGGVSGSTFSFAIK